MKHSSAEGVKYSSAEGVKHSSTEGVKHSSTEGVKHSSTENCITPAMTKVKFISISLLLEHRV